MNTKGRIRKEKIVQGDAAVSFAMRLVPEPCKKKQLRYIADPRIELYKTGGRTYYRFRRGIDAPEHLGTADYILQAVREKRKKDKASPPEQGSV